MKKTFFDSLMISDSERIHTQTLSWILQLDDLTFTRHEKAELLRRIFKLRTSIDIESQYVETELNKIDLFVDFGGHQFIIENKLKSSEHSNQTKNYLSSIPESFNQYKSRKFGFLTLIKEKAKNDVWVNISFEELLKELNAVDWRKQTRDYLFVEEYLVTLSNLVKVFNDFMKKHQNYSNVFSDGHKKKYDKKASYDEDFKNYIKANQLETIFQKAFLKQIAEDIGLLEYYISETRGTALIQTYLHKLKIADEKFNIGFQFQGKTLKINLSHEQYGSSSFELINEGVIGIFRDTFYQVDGYNKLNKPRSKAYISVSKSIGDELYKLSKEQIKSLLRKELDLLSNKIPLFEKRIKIKNL